MDYPSQWVSQSAPSTSSVGARLCLPLPYPHRSLSPPPHTPWFFSLIGVTVCGACLDFRCLCMSVCLCLFVCLMSVGLSLVSVSPFLVCMPVSFCRSIGVCLSIPVCCISSLRLFRSLPTWLPPHSSAASPAPLPLPPVSALSTRLHSTTH